MNENQIKMILPPTVGILVAGVASGICYLLIGSLRKGKGSKSVSYDDSRCACCLKPFLVGRGVECNDCGARSCRKACCRWDSVENSWFCLFCYHNRSWAKKRDKWFRSFGGLPVDSENSKSFSTAKSRVYDEGAEHVAIHTELDLAAGGRKEGDSMETVREFVEKIVQGLVGNVDDTPIDSLYDHPAYDRLFETYGAILASTLTRLAMSLRQCIGNKPATDTPTMAHTALRELVERAVDEARKLPCLGATVSTELREDSSFSEQNYEDLLATAILNKVIEKFQNERVDGNSNVVHRRTRSKYANHDNENGLDEGVEEGSSSLEPLSQDECSSEGSGSRTRHARIRTEPLSLTIEEQIEEVTTTYTSDEELRCSKTNVLDFRNSRRVPFPEFGMDIVDPSQDSSDDSQEEENDLTHVDIVTPVESWEENWLFQKRKIQTQSEPVSMLVPNPSADYRALIGDKDAEDTSDLSEFSAQSDDEIEDDELIEAINRSIPAKSSEIESTNFLANDKASRENDKNEESSRNVSDDRTTEIIDEREPIKLELNLNEEFEKVFRQNIDEKTNLTKDKRENGGSELSKNSYDPAKYVMKNPEIPKTPASSPVRNELPEFTTEVNSGCDFRQLNEKRVFIDKIVDEESSENTILRVEACEKKGYKIEKEKLLSTCDVNENIKSSTINRCGKDVSQEEQLEMESGIEQSKKVVQKLLSNSSNGEVKLNGDAKKIEEFETITNASPTEEIDSLCEPLVKAKVVLISEKPNSRNATDDNIELATPPRPGTIAEREHKKWENAAPIENNPYSEENIQKRLLARQYARRSSSDVSGNSTKLQTSPSSPLQIVLGAGRPDFKRFGRDYYINEAKSPNGRSIETGFYTATSRPNSSMSQNSLSTGSDYEHQERSRSVETESTCSTSSETRSRVIADSRRNNVEIALRRGSMPTDSEYETSQVSSVRESENNDRRQSSSDVSRYFFNEILESERKNNKNEINARLNNRGNFEDNSKSIKRIDLRAYGFENEFSVKNGGNKLPTRKSMRVINKLDLRRFGYDSGLRRTQSNSNIDGGVKINSTLRSRGRNSDEAKSNLAGHGERSFSGNSSNEALTKSTESSSEEGPEDFGKIKSAKSVPNIRDLCSRIGKTTRESDRNEIDGGSICKDESTFVENGNNAGSKIRDGISETSGRGNIEIKAGSLLPSVRRLAQAFNRTEEATMATARKPSKTVNNSTKDRPTTPEIQIVDTPRQMHSLTARSISREFREGLRQITSKQTTAPRAQIFSEQNHRSPESSRPTTSQVGSGEDTSVMAPGKLKSNIKFWEQMHRKS